MELLIVIVLLGVLVTLGLSSFRTSQLKSRDSRRKSELRQISLALEAYMNDKGKYPNDDAGGKIKGCYPDDNTVCPWGGEFKDQNNTIYMIALPADPGMYTYYYDVLGSSNAQYQLYSRLENTQDSDVKKDASNNPQAYSGVSCGGKLCNYGISSTNTSPESGRTLTTE